jgi:type VI secretion system protein VasD
MSAPPDSLPARPARPPDGASWRRLTTAGLLAAALAGCSIPPSTPLIGSKETTVVARITTAATLNPDVRRRPSPLVVRVYELAARNAFDSADFVSLYERDKDALAADLVTREEIVLQPGEARDWNKKLMPQTKFIAVVAAYREIERASWRAVLPIKQVAVNRVTIQADELAIRLVPASR